MLYVMWKNKSFGAQNYTLGLLKSSGLEVM